MAKGRITTLTVTLTPEAWATLHAWQRSTTIQVGLARRARAVLLRAEGQPITAIAATVGVARRCVYKWLARFLVHGVEGLYDLPRPGPPQKGGRRQWLSTSGTQPPARSCLPRRGRKSVPAPACRQGENTTGGEQRQGMQEEDTP